MFPTMANHVILAGPVNSPHKWPVTRQMFPFDDVIMIPSICLWNSMVEIVYSYTDVWPVVIYIDLAAHNCSYDSIAMGSNLHYAEA